MFRAAFRCPFSILEVGPMKAIVCSLAVVAALLPCKCSSAQAPEPSHDGLPLSQWIRGTNHPTAYIRAYAASEIGAIGPAAKVAVPALIILLHDKDNDVRASAARALGAIGPTAIAAVPALIEELDDPWRYVSDAAAVALGNVGPDAKNAVPALMHILQSEWLMNRRHAAETLGKIGPDAKAATATLVEAMIDDDGDLREAAFAALKGIGADSNMVVAALARHLDPHEPIDSMTSALKALRRYGPAAKDAIPEIAALLRNQASFQDAFDTLTEMGSVASPVLPQLVATARDPRARSLEAAKNEILPTKAECAKLVVQWMHDDGRNRANGERLWKVLGAEVLPLVAPMLKSDSTTDRAMALDMFYELAGAGVPTLVYLMKEGDPDDRRIAFRILGHLGSSAKVAVPALATALAAKDSEDRCLAAIALGQIGADAAPAVAALADSLTDMDGGVRVCAIEALGRIGPAAAPATAGLVERLHDTSPAVRSAAARAIGKIGPAAKAALPELEKLAHDHEDYVRQAAEEALKAITRNVSRTNGGL
jgi:HEAT repeat protein